MARMIRSSSRIVANPPPVRQDGPMRPMLASAGTAVPVGPQWAHEIKWDGMRLLADVADGRVRLSSRNENDVTSTFPEPVSYTHLRAHETDSYLVCRLLLEKK